MRSPELGGDIVGLSAARARLRVDCGRVISISSEILSLMLLGECVTSITDRVHRTAICDCGTEGVRLIMCS